jgi:transposase InsO family protein
LRKCQVICRTPKKGVSKNCSSICRIRPRFSLPREHHRFGQGRAGALEQAIGDFIDQYNHHRYHQSLGNLTSADAYPGRAETILRRRKEIK